MRMDFGWSRRPWTLRLIWSTTRWGPLRRPGSCFAGCRKYPPSRDRGRDGQSRFRRDTEALFAEESERFVRPAQDDLGTISAHPFKKSWPVPAFFAVGGKTRSTALPGPARIGRKGGASRCPSSSPTWSSQSRCGDSRGQPAGRARSRYFDSDRRTQSRRRDCGGGSPLKKARRNPTSFRSRVEDRSPGRSLRARAGRANRQKAAARLAEIFPVESFPPMWIVNHRSRSGRSSG